MWLRIFGVELLSFKSEQELEALQYLTSSLGNHIFPAFDITKCYFTKLVGHSRQKNGTSVRKITASNRCPHFNFQRFEDFCSSGSRHVSASASAFLWCHIPRRLWSLGVKDNPKTAHLPHMWALSDSFQGIQLQLHHQWHLSLARRGRPAYGATKHCLALKKQLGHPHRSFFSILGNAQKPPVSWLWRLVSVLVDSFATI